MMKYFLLFFLFFCSSFPVEGQDQPLSNTFTDPRDNQTYQTLTINREVGMGVVVTHTWMVENLNFETPDSSWCYEDKAENCEKYSRLYTWEAAQNACPEGWHLPSDLEWQILVHQFSDGGLVYDEERGAKAVYKALVQNGESDFAALLGGYRYSDGEFIYLGRAGNYWTSSEGDAGYGWSYDFDGVVQRLDRSYHDKTLGFSCRCVKD